MMNLRSSTTTNAGTPSGNRRFRNKGLNKLPYRSTTTKNHGSKRRSKTSFSIALAFVLVLMTQCWFLIFSFKIHSKYNLDGNQPIWTVCPSGSTSQEREEHIKEKDICFITCIFGGNVVDVDQPANVEFFRNHWCHTRFLLATNLPDLPAPGWTKIISETATRERDGYKIDNINSKATSTEQETSSNNKSQLDVTKNHIVQSRHAKFLAWDALSDITPKYCAAVIYMDGYLIPKRFMSWRSFFGSLFFSPPWSPSSPLFEWFPRIPGGKRSPPTQIPPPAKFQAVVRQVQTHRWGLSQVKQRYFDGLPMTTLLKNLVRDRKDTKEHVAKTIEWFHSQVTNFEEIMPYYLNKYFAYDPSNQKYRDLSSYFWETYTTYGGVWRDQPLWAYTLHRFNVTPAVMTTEGTITKGGDLFQTGGKLGWGKHVYV